jgi:hypothetical protein
VAFFPVISPPKQTTLVLALFYHTQLPSYRSSSQGLESRIGCGLCACNLPPKQTTLVLAPFFIVISFRATETRTVSRSFHLSKISSWFQGINMPSIGLTGVSLLELQGNIRAYRHIRIHSFSFIYKMMICRHYNSATVHAARRKSEDRLLIFH